MCWELTPKTATEWGVAYDRSGEESEDSEHSTETLVEGSTESENATEMEEEGVDINDATENIALSLDSPRVGQRRVDFSFL